jgi:hypothetical protein
VPREILAKKQSAIRAVTNEDLAQAIAGIETRLGLRIDKLETTVKKSGLNGETVLLADFLKREAAQHTRKSAYAEVRSDLGRRMRWLLIPRGWLKMLGAAIVGGSGWAIANHLLSIWPTPTLHP